MKFETTDERFVNEIFSVWLLHSMKQLGNYALNNKLVPSHFNVGAVWFYIR